jgi:hypothetical protein
MNVLFPEPDGPAIRKICLRSLATAARTSRRSVRSGRGLSKDRPERKVMLLVNSLPAPANVIKVSY